MARSADTFELRSSGVASCTVFSLIIICVPLDSTLLASDRIARSHVSTRSSKARTAEQSFVEVEVYRSLCDAGDSIILLNVFEYRIIWHINPPYVARAAELRAFWGGLYQRGAYMPIFGPYLVSTNLPIRHVNSSYISGVSTPTVLITYNIPTFWSNSFLH